jgi:hypothetical protein
VLPSERSFFARLGERVLSVRAALVHRLVQRNAAPRVVDLLGSFRVVLLFTTGLVIHFGSQTLPLGERLQAVPVSALWRSDS